MNINIRLGNLFRPPQIHQVGIGDILTLKVLAWSGINIQKDDNFKAVLEALNNLSDDEFVKVTMLIEPVKPIYNEKINSLEIN